MRSEDYTAVELVDEVSENGPLTVTSVRINGERVRVAAHGIKIDYDVPGPFEDAERFVMVTLDLLVDEFRIHRVTKPEPRNSAEHKITDPPPVD